MADVEAYLIYLKNERQVKASTRKRHLGALRSFSRWADHRDHLAEDITEKLEPIKVQTKERYYLSESEVETFIEAINHDLVKVAVQLMYHSGLRISECVNQLNGHFNQIMIDGLDK